MFYERSMLYEPTMLSKPFCGIAFGYPLEPTLGVYYIELVFDNLLAMLANYCICRRHMRQKLLLCIQPVAGFGDYQPVAVIVDNKRRR